MEYKYIGIGVLCYLLVGLFNLLYSRFDINEKVLEEYLGSDKQLNHLMNEQMFLHVVFWFIYSSIFKKK